ncbi:MAG TPA: family 16 glycosylhydrolase [Nocardioides sp.]|nr:family 16 glycosylhydrolase [Nocardioides sp.]
MRSRIAVALLTGLAVAATAAAPAGADVKIATAVVAPLAVAADPAAARQTASLSVSPDKYYAGQGLRFSGSLRRSGRQTVWLEYNMNRPGDAWTRIEGTNHATDASGRFSFRNPAPAMYNISLRVNSASGPTPGHLFHAVDELMTLAVRPASGHWSAPVGGWGYVDFRSYPAVAGDPFVVTVDTSPEGGPVLAGRTVALQQRVKASTWQSVGTGTVGNDGLVTFRRTVDTAGIVVYRARAEAWRKAGSRIGWNPSFPTYVYVHDRSGHGPDPSVAAPAERTTAAGPTSPAPALRGSSATSAGQRFTWGEPLFDFGYEWGESLTDPPFRGKRKRGAWREASTGSGRVGRHNGGMFFESSFGTVGPRDAGSGDFGTTSATLTGNAATYGRWEVRLRAWDLGDAGGDYHVRAELVPANPVERACGRAITIADFTPGGHDIGFGASSRLLSWTARRSGVDIEQEAHTYGAEVTKTHITWFLDGAPIRTLLSPDAIPRVPLTLRLSLVGDGTSEMRHTYAGADWIRAWDLSRGHQVTSLALLLVPQVRLGVSC